MTIWMIRWLRPLKPPIADPGPRGRDPLCWTTRKMAEAQIASLLLRCEVKGKVKAARGDKQVLALGGDPQTVGYRDDAGLIATLDEQDEQETTP